MKPLYIKISLLLSGFYLFVISACSQDSQQPPVINKKSTYRFLNNIILEEEFRIGVFEAPNEYTFSNIIDIEVGLNGEIYVLDKGDWIIKIFDKNGIFKKSVGGRGSGPGEMQVPSGISFQTKTRKLLLCDRALKRITIFDEEGRYLSSIKLEQAGNFFSISENEAENFFLFGAQNEQVIHKFDIRGNLLHSFGKTYPDKNHHLQSFFSHGAFCVDNDGSIYYFPDGENEIRTLDRNGNLIDTIFRISEYTSIKYEKIASGGIQYSFQEGLSHFSFPISLHLHPQRFLISQHSNGASRSDHRKIITEIHNLSSKKSYVVSDSLAAIGDIDFDGSIYCYQNAPVSQVIKYSTIVNTSEQKN